MRVAVYSNTCARAGRPVMENFVSSLRDDKIEILNCTTNFDHNCDASVMWSVQLGNTQRRRIWEYHRKKGIPIIILEIGVLYRKLLWKVGINNIDNTAEFANTNSPSDRWNKFELSMKPWKKIRGENIIICPQNDRAGHWPSTLTSEIWVDQTIKELRKHTIRPIILRPHPRSPIKMDTENYTNVTKQNPKEISLAEACEDAWAIINASSNPGVESILNGIPAFCWPNSIVAPVGNLDLNKIENPSMPDRTQWAHNFAYSEWTKDEILQGIPWKRLKPFISSS